MCTKIKAIIIQNRRNQINEDKEFESGGEKESSEEKELSGEELYGKKGVIIFFAVLILINAFDKSRDPRPCFMLVS